MLSAQDTKDNMTMKIATIVFSGLALLGCVPLHTLVDSPRPKGPIASLDYNKKLIIYILKIDGKRVFDDDVDHFEFLPGIHTLSIRFHTAPKREPIHNGQEFDLSFDAKPGHKYKIKFSINQDYSKWSAYILDLDSNSRVSSIITDND